MSLRNGSDLRHDEIRHQTADGFWVCWDKTPVELSPRTRAVIDECSAALGVMLAGASVRRVGPYPPARDGLRGATTRFRPATKRLGDEVDREPAIRVTDALEHDLLGETAHYRDRMIDWLNLEEAAGELTPGLAEYRDMLIEDRRDAES